jgi:serine protease Do
MTLEVPPALSAAEISQAIAGLANSVARSVIVVRGSRGSTGSGVIWNRPRLVITNAHVASSRTAELVLGNGHRVPARLVRHAPAVDLAALETDVDLSVPAQVGDSGRMRPGDLVIAVGNPMGERNAPSLGIVSRPSDDVLQLAITLRPGNSGGALANAEGEVVGIPHMVAGKGLALAISTRAVERFLESGVEPDLELTWI